MFKSKSAVYARSYLVTLGLIFSATGAFFLYAWGGTLPDWPWWGQVTVAVLLVMGPVLVVGGLFGPSRHMQAWAELASRHEAALIFLVLAYPLYRVLKPFYEKR
ncbi:hypothetical protein [Luteimonas sp. e5]